jgi:ribonucleoside-diphosphate reductase alpha chain
MTAGFPGASAASRVRQPGTLIPSPRFFTTGLLPNPLGLSVLPSTLPGPGVWSGPAARGEGRKLGFRGVSCGPVRAWVGGGESESFGSTTRAWTPGAAQRRAGGEPAERHHQPGRLGRLQDGGRRDPRAAWSQLATDIVVSKYFRKAGLHGDKRRGETQRAPGRAPHRAHHPRGRRALRRLLRHAEGRRRVRGRARATCSSTSTARSTRPCGSTAASGTATASRARAATSRGTRREHDLTSGARTRRSVSRRQRLRAPAVLGVLHPVVDDDLMSIYDLVKSEARLFKYGSGTGTNFSAIRGKQEKLSGGGTSSSGLMSFLEVFDRAAGATKSRRHHAPRREDGLPRHGPPGDRRLHRVEGARGEEGAGPHRRRATPDFNGEAYHTVSGQNSNNSIRVTDEFMRAVESGRRRGRRARTTGEVVDTYKRGLWKQARRGRVGLRRPGRAVRHDHQRWHTCPNTARINASNPCSEYMFLDDTACNLSSLNLTKFLARTAASTSRATATRCACSSSRRRSSSISRATPRSRSRRTPTTTARSASATRTSARCSCSSGLPYDSDEGRASRRAHGDPVRPRVPRLGGDGGAARARSRASRRTASPCSA